MNASARILLVDDEERFRQSLRRILEAGGHTVVEASEGQAALDELGRAAFDVVLLDMKMPGLSGEETFHQIVQRGFDVETICLTGHVSVQDATRLLQRGAFDYLLKPASVEEILECVGRALESKLLRNDEIDVSHLIGRSVE
jgi:DNA-binding NtrC family response regulator